MGFEQLPSQMRTKGIHMQKKPSREVLCQAVGYADDWTIWCPSSLHLFLSTSHTYRGSYQFAEA